MAKTVWKYTLDPKTRLSMPIGAEVLSAHEQDGEICLWALVDSDMDEEDRIFNVYGTGHDIPKNISLKFVGTAMVNNNRFVFHVFEEYE